MLKKTLAALALGSALFTAGQAMAADYKIDKEGQHAFIEFRIKHLGYSWLYGRFNDFDGSFTFDEKNPSADKVKVTINTNSVDTNHAERDKHLRSGDFLNVSKNPTATFESTEVKANGDSADITGNLTLNGVTKPVTIKAKLIGQGDDPWGGYRAGFEGSATLKLKDFGIKMDLGPASQEVELLLSVEAFASKRIPETKNAGDRRRFSLCFEKNVLKYPQAVARPGIGRGDAPGWLVPPG